MQAGRLDRRILIQNKAAMRNARGEEIVGWVDLVTTWAGVKVVGGGEEFRTDQRANRQRTQFTIRWRPDLAPTCRVIYEGQSYEITNVGEGEGRRQELQLEGEGKDVGT
jgi:SPP1 family predicted phage head-tail adaptor